MEIRNTISAILLVAGGLFTLQAHSATIGTYTFDDSSIANELISANGYITNNGSDLYYASGSSWSLYNGSGWDAASPLADATDSSTSSYLAAITGYGPTSMDLGFGNTSVFNGDGSDIVFFFLWDQSSNSTTVSINGHSQELVTSDLYDSSSNLFLINNVAWDNSLHSNVLMVAAEIDLSDFGMLANSILDEPVSLSMQSDSTSPVALSMMAALNADPSISAVPLPAPLVLLLSGLVSIGLFSRRKK